MATENGWEPSPRIEPGSSLLVWKTVPDTDVNLQVRNDDAGKIMIAYACDYHNFVEKLRDADSACYTPNNSVSTSNHLNATAMDLNWNSHPFQVNLAGFTPAMVAAMRDLLAFYEGMMFWAQDWDSPKDAMHHQMGYGTYGKTADFVKRKIRSDGRSTYKRGALAGDPPVVPDKPVEVDVDRQTAITVLYDAVPIIDEAFSEKILDEVIAGLAMSQCNTPKRIAMWLAQVGLESDGFKATEEYGKGAGKPYAPYCGRTWIQITWDYNYRAFGVWAKAQGLVSDNSVFVNNPSSLADPKWAGIGAAWYWTIQRPAINSMCDNGDLLGVTKAINGGTNGLEDFKGQPGRRTRYNQAIALGDRLLALVAKETSEGEEVDKEQADRIEAKLDEVLAQLNIDGRFGQTGSDADAIKTLEANFAAGKPLTLLDMVAWIKLHISARKSPNIPPSPKATK